MVVCSMQATLPVRKERTQLVEGWVVGFGCGMRACKGCPFDLGVAPGKVHS